MYISDNLLIVLVTSCIVCFKPEPASVLKTATVLKVTIIINLY